MGPWLSFGALASGTLYSISIYTSRHNYPHSLLVILPTNTINLNSFCLHRLLIQIAYTSTPSNDKLVQHVKICVLFFFNFQFNLWDTVGLEEYAQLTRSQFLLSQAVLFVYSADDRDSLSQVAELLQLAKINAQGACFILITNKIDLTETVSADDISECFPNNPFTLTLRTSALTGDGIQEMVQSVARHLFRKATPMKSIGRHTLRGEGASFNNSSTHCNNGSLEVIQLNIEEKQVPRRKKKCCHH